MFVTGRGLARSEELPTHECWSLLRSAAVGRLAWSGSDGLSVLTMNFAVVDDEIVLRTLPYGSVATQCVDRAVAFQTDEVDRATRTGWSVLARGRLSRDEDGEVPRDLVDVWPEGSRVLTLRLAVHRLTGRRLAA